MLFRSIICEILLMHINNDILDADGHINQNKIDLVARLGGNWYSRNSGSALFQVPKPNLKPAIGIDQLPDGIRNSNILSGNDLGMLGNAEHLPTADELSSINIESELNDLKQRFLNDPESLRDHKHLLAKEFLSEHQTLKAWKILLS